MWDKNIHFHLVAFRTAAAAQKNWHFHFPFIFSSLSIHLTNHHSVKWFNCTWAKPAFRWASNKKRETVRYVVIYHIGQAHEYWGRPKKHFNSIIAQCHSLSPSLQIASACWELYCLEHGIAADGTMCCQDNNDDDNSNTFFHSCLCPTTQTIKAIPRVVLVDLEPIPIDEIRTGCYRELFDPCTLVTGKEDAGSNFARGYNTLGCEMIELALDRVRRVAENCDCMQGFITFRSVGGGTGSGFGSLLQERLTEEFAKSNRHEFNIFPSPRRVSCCMLMIIYLYASHCRLSSIIVEPYNALLTTHYSMDYSDCNILLDNEALYDVCGNSLEVCSPIYTNINRVIGQVVSTCTASLRFEGPMNVDMIEFQTNLVPYPRIHFPLCTYSPFIPRSAGGLGDQSTIQITQSCFHPSTQLVKCDPLQGKYICCCMLYRGAADPTDINVAIKNLKCRKDIRFVDWSPSAFKIGINSQPPTCWYPVEMGEIFPLIFIISAPFKLSCVD